VTPVTDSPAPTHEDFALIEKKLFTRIGVRYRRQVVRHRLIGLAAIVVIAGAGVAAGTVASLKQQSNTASCYGGDSLNSQMSEGATSSATGQSAEAGVTPTAAAVARVMRLCDDLWEAGMFGTPTKHPPRLQACLQDNLVIAVFPKRNESLAPDAFCNNLGLSAP
jgi:hypothetical protein